MTSRLELLADATTRLAVVSDSARLDAQVLLAHVLDCERSALITRENEPVTGAAAGTFHALLARRQRGEPVAYLTGQREFWSLSLRVTPAVLVPRPETELLVELALRRLPAGQTCEVLDLGTGSGAIALALATERPAAHITGCDASAAALAVARSNAQRLSLAQVRLREGDWFEAVPGERFDLVVCNPPYVAAADPHMAALFAEPAAALTPGPTGLEAFERIVPASPAHLREGGWLLLEHGADQTAAVQNLLEHHGFHDVTSHPDASGTPRVTLGSFHSNHQGLP